MRMKSIAKYEKKIQELSELLQRKNDECYQSWMSWTAANEQLAKVRMELDNKTYQTYSLGKIDIQYVLNNVLILSRMTVFNVILGQGMGLLFNIRIFRIDLKETRM